MSVFVIISVDGGDLEDEAEFPKSREASSSNKIGGSDGAHKQCRKRKEESKHKENAQVCEKILEIVRLTVGVVICIGCRWEKASASRRPTLSWAKTSQRRFK